MREEPVTGLEAAHCGSDLFRWRAQIAGPEGSPYEGGKFELDLRLPSRYPLEPPHLTFRTPIFHPNVNGRGDICLDVLKSQWSPAVSLQKVLLSVSSLLTDPNFSDPLNAAATQLFKKDRAGYDARCRELIRLHAMPADAPAKASAGSASEGGSRGQKRRAGEVLLDSPSAASAQAAGMNAPASVSGPAASAAAALSVEPADCY